MKKVLFAAVLSVVALTLALPAFAQEVKKEAKKHELTGTIKAVDAAKGAITVTNKDGVDKDLTVGEKTKGAALADLKVGDKVKVTYTEVAGKISVKAIALVPAEKVKATAPAPAATTK